MPSSTYASTHRSGRTGNDQASEPPAHGGVRNIAARDGYDPGDGYILPNPQLWPPPIPASGETYGTGSARSAGTDGFDGRSRRGPPRMRAPADFSDESDDDDDDDDDGFNGSRDGDLEDGRRGRGPRDGGFRFGPEKSYHRRVVHKRYGPTRPRSMDDDRGGPRDPFYYRRDSDDSQDDVDDDDDNRSRGRRRSSLSKLAMIRRPSLSVTGLRRKVTDLMYDSDNERTGNTELKKLGATMAGALAGGLAAQQAGKKYGQKHWVPMALGAFMGGFTAREAEKLYFKRKATKDEERDDDDDEWDDGPVYRSGRKRSRSRGR